MELVVYTSTGELKYPRDKAGNSTYEKVGEDLVQDGSQRLFVDVEDGLVRGWFEEKPRIQQRFFLFKGPKGSPDKLRKAFEEALEEYFDSRGLSLTDNDGNNFLKEYLAGSPDIDLPHSKRDYEKELEKEGILIIVGNSRKGAMETAREISRGLGNASYMALVLRNGLNQKALSRLTNSTRFRPVPQIVAFPERRAKNGQTFKSYKKQRGSGSRNSGRSRKTRERTDSNSSLNPLNWF